MMRNEGAATFGVIFMTFSTDYRFLVAYYQEIDNQSIKISTAGQGLFCLWDIEKKTILSTYDSSRKWVDLIFPSVLNC